ncbi:beta-lactamase/transpeptidase-like protein [Mycena polygramma]|nr:beta-lactamase/transpeptidase-like protein [Mycena polygramma]
MSKEHLNSYRPHKPARGRRFPLALWLCQRRTRQESKSKIFQDKLRCRAPLPTLFASHPPAPGSPGLEEQENLSINLCRCALRRPDIDSLSIAVVTPDGPIFERGYGLLKANESAPDKFGSVTRDSIYRIASITKMFTHTPDNSPITLRQLASHLSGIGRDYPPVDVGETWPAPIFGADEDYKFQGLVDRNLEELLDAVATIPLATPQYTFPLYSNAGFDILGLSNVAAHNLATGEETTHRQLMQDHVFDPLGLNSSFYVVPNDRLAAQIAVPASYSEWADLAMHPVNDPSGGLYSSLADLTTVMQSFLSPEAMRWLQEVGAPWEIAKVGREARLYSKGGNLPGYHSQFSLNPQWSYGVIVLVSGNYTDTVTLAQEAISRFQPALDTYGGVWVGDDSLAVITIQDQALYLDALVIRDQDVLNILQRNPSGGSKAVALWSTGRLHEFRMAFGRPELNDNPDAGCEPYWISLDYPVARGAPLDLLFWDGSN